MPSTTHLLTRLVGSRGSPHSGGTAGPRKVGDGRAPHTCRPQAHVTNCCSTFSCLLLLPLCATNSIISIPITIYNFKLVRQLQKHFIIHILPHFCGTDYHESAFFCATGKKLHLCTSTIITAVLLSADANSSTKAVRTMIKNSDCWWQHATEIMVPQQLVDDWASVHALSLITTSPWASYQPHQINTCHTSAKLFQY